MGFLPHWSAFGVVDFPSYILGAILIVLLPGPNSIYVLSVSAQQGWRSGAWASIGIFIADGLIMLAVALGAASLLSSSPMLFNALRYLGAAYLAWLGIGIARSGLARMRSKTAVSNTVSAMATGVMRLHPFWAALLLALTNPKAIFFFLSFFTQFVDPHFHAPALSFFYLAIATQIISMVYLGLLIGMGQYCLGMVAAHPKIAAGVWLGTGALFLLFSLRLLSESF